MDNQSPAPSTTPVTPGPTPSVPSSSSSVLSPSQPVFPIMPTVCDQCQPLLHTSCSRQYPCCYHCDKKRQVCSYTKKVMEVCRPCRFGIGEGNLQSCDRKVPRCSNCQSLGLACYNLEVENIEYNKTCTQCSARRCKCTARQNAEPCEFCKSEKLPCSYVRARYTARE